MGEIGLSEGTKKRIRARCFSSLVPGKRWSKSALRSRFLAFLVGFFSGLEAGVSAASRLPSAGPGGHEMAWEGGAMVGEGKKEVGGSTGAGVVSYMTAREGLGLFG